LPDPRSGCQERVIYCNAIRLGNLFVRPYIETSAPIGMIRFKTLLLLLLIAPAAVRAEYKGLSKMPQGGKTGAFQPLEQENLGEASLKVPASEKLKLQAIRDTELAVGRTNPSPVGRVSKGETVEVLEIVSDKLFVKSGGASRAAGWVPRASFTEIPEATENRLREAVAARERAELARKQKRPMMGMTHAEVLSAMGKPDKSSFNPELGNGTVEFDVYETRKVTDQYLGADGRILQRQSVKKTKVGVHRVTFEGNVTVQVEYQTIPVAQEVPGVL
jgi:hypothetical protein